MESWCNKEIEKRDPEEPGLRSIIKYIVGGMGYFPDNCAKGGLCVSREMHRACECKKMHLERHHAGTATLQARAVLFLGSMSLAHRHTLKSILRERQVTIREVRRNAGVCRIDWNMTIRHQTRWFRVTLCPQPQSQCAEHTMGCRASHCGKKSSLRVELRVCPLKTELFAVT